MKGVSSTLLELLLSTIPAADEAVDTLTRRQALQHYHNGRELMAEERYQVAEGEFSAAIKLDPLLTLAHYGLGQSQMAQRRYESAVQAFLRCREAYEQIATLSQIETAASERLRTEAIHELRESIGRARAGQIKGADPAVLRRLEARLEDLEGAAANTARPLYIPGEVYLALGSAYSRAGCPTEAEREWRAATQVDSELGEAHNNLASLYMMTGRKQQAEEAVKAAERARFRVNPQLKEDIRRMK
jgi:tetratricopeptide (TPR) repeat protein